MKPIVTETYDIRAMAQPLRFLSIDAVERAGSGHPGMPLGFADAMTVLACHFLHLDPQAPRWFDRDRLILSAGHGSMLLYALGYLLGYEDLGIEDLKNFRQLGARTAGHPEYGLASIIETTTGPLAQGLANAVGFALAERMLAARFGSELVDHYTYVIVGDGCLMEGLSHEACSLAGHLGLGKLIVLFDDNGISIDGPTSLAVSDDHAARLASYGWHTADADGYDSQAMITCLRDAHNVTEAPSFIALRSVIGFGAPNKQGSEKAHGSPLGADEVAQLRTAFAWHDEPFVVPKDLLARWRAVPMRARQKRLAWETRLRQHKNRHAFEAMCQKDMTQYGKLLETLKQTLSEKKPTWATRKASGEVLATLFAQDNKAGPLLIGGSADLSGSNVTQTQNHTAVKCGQYHHTYIHYGVREHGMAAMMNGMSLHGGIVPYGGTFLVFSDYARPAIRLSALMGLHVIYVMTHDSIGLGEDGPTHQPIEHLASLRAIPNMLVFRPADSLEVIECWQLALTLGQPSLLVLSRQDLPFLETSVRGGRGVTNHCRAGGYVLWSSPHAPHAEHVSFLASGSEVHIALQAARQLASEGIGCRVVSLPCFGLFDALPKEERLSILGRGGVRIGIEASSGSDWHGYLVDEACQRSEMVCLKGFGASGRAEDLYEHFGLTVACLLERVRHVLLSFFYFFLAF